MTQNTTARLILNELRAKRMSLLIYCLAGAATIWLYVSIFPSLQSQAKDLSKIFDAMPKEVLKAFGAEGTGLEGVESFLAGKQFGLVWPLLAIILMLNRAAGSIAGDIEQNTIGTLLAQPFSRFKIYATKYTAGVITLLLFVVFSVLVSIPIISAYHLTYSAGYELLFAGMCVLYGLAIYGMGMAVSAVVNERSRVYSIVGGSVVLMFVLNLISGLKPSLENLKYSSFFYYFNPHDILVNHHINSASVILFGVIAVVGTVAGLVCFTRRDISI